MTGKSGFGKVLKSGRTEKPDRVDALSPVLHEHSKIWSQSPMMSTSILLFVYNDFICVHSYCLSSILAFQDLLASFDLEVLFVISTFGVWFLLFYILTIIAPEMNAWSSLSCFAPSLHGSSNLKLFYLYILSLSSKLFKPKGCLTAVAGFSNTQDEWGPNWSPLTDTTCLRILVSMLLCICEYFCPKF